MNLTHLAHTCLLPQFTHTGVRTQSTRVYATHPVARMLECAQARTHARTSVETERMRR